MSDEPGAIEMWVPESITFDSTDATWVVVHKTAGFSTAQDCAAYFQAGSDGNNVSSHYIVGLDGTIIQCVPESRGAGANCCTTAGHADYLPTDVNLNLKTISVEHIDPSTDNSTPMPQAQKDASYRLIGHICERHNIPKRSGDASGGIIGHRDIDPVNRARCPGNYDWNGLWAYLKGGATVGVPQGWHDDGTTLTAPNGISVVQGFRDYILNNAWDPGNLPLAREQGLNPVELGNPSLGSGTQQIFRTTVLEWTARMGVFVAWGGQELLATKAALATTQGKLTSLQGAYNTVVTEKNQLIGLRDANTATIAQLNQQINDLKQQLASANEATIAQLQQEIATLTTQLKAAQDQLVGFTTKIGQIEIILKG